MTIKGVASVVIGLLFAVFVVQNAQVVAVRFLFWKAQASMALVLLGAFALGLIAGWLYGRVHKKR
jgi:putative membrane protein